MVWKCDGKKIKKLNEDYRKIDLTTRHNKVKE